MKIFKVAFTGLVLLAGSFTFAQTNVLDYNSSPSAADGHAYVKHHDYQNRVLDYPFVREDDILWSKTYIQRLDLRQRKNHPLYFPRPRTRRSTWRDPGSALQGHDARSRGRGAAPGSRQQGLRSGTAQPAVGLGPDLRAHRRSVRLCGVRGRCVQPPYRRLANIELTEERLGARRSRAGHQ